MMEQSIELWKQIQTTFSKLDILDKPFADSIAYDYILSKIYSEFEISLEKIFHDAMKSPNKFTNNYLSENRIHRGLGIKEISNILRSMKILGKNDKLVSDEICNIHGKFIDARHIITHAMGDRTTLLDINKVIKNSKIILDKIYSICNKN